VVAERQAMQARNAQRHRAGLLALCRDRNIPLASHDDTVPEHVEEAVASGISLGFTTVAALLHGSTDWASSWVRPT
jgi:alpha-D-ribose 1-methylphosphonate 5-triphosphate diphosphatase PhnM